MNEPTTEGVKLLRDISRSQPVLAILVGAFLTIYCVDAYLDHEQKDRENALLRQMLANCGGQYARPHRETGPVLQGGAQQSHPGSAYQDGYGP